MPKLILILITALLFEAIGVVWLSHGLKQIGDLPEISPRAIGHIVVRGVTNRYVLLGVLFEAIFFVTLLVLLKNWDVSLIWPLTSLGFVLTTLAAKYLRHEDISGLRWGGVALIVLGATLVGWSEQVKTRVEAPPASAANRSAVRPEGPRSE